jgi:hypothetical protein
MATVQETAMYPKNIHCTHFCWGLSRPQDYSAAGRIRSIEKSNEHIGYRTRLSPAAYVRLYQFWCLCKKHYVLSPLEQPASAIVSDCRTGELVQFQLTEVSSRLVRNFRGERQCTEQVTRIPHRQTHKPGTAAGHIKTHFTLWHSDCLPHPPPISESMYTVVSVFQSAHAPCIPERKPGYPVRDDYSQQKETELWAVEKIWRLYYNFRQKREMWFSVLY